MSTLESLEPWLSQWDEPPRGAILSNAASVQSHIERFFFENSSTEKTLVSHQNPERSAAPSVTSARYSPKPLVSPRRLYRHCGQNVPQPRKKSQAGWRKYFP